MSERILVKKATRIEGNATIHVEIEKGRAKAVRFQVADFRGFEKFVQGKQAGSVPHIVSRICGLCCVAHQVAGFRAVEKALGVQVPVDVERLRQIAIAGEWIASHSLSYFFLTLPEQLGASCGVFDLMREHPEVAAKAFWLRKAGNRIVEVLCKRSVHPVATGIGSFLTVPTAAGLAELRNLATEICKRTLEELEAFGKQPQSACAVPFPVGHSVNFLTFDETAPNGSFRTFNRHGEQTAAFSTDDFEGYVSEVRVDWSLAKLPFLSSLGFPDGIVLVGPLSRIFRDQGIRSEPDLAGLELTRRISDNAALGIDHLDVCRLLEIYCAAKRISTLLDEVDLSRPLAATFDPEVSGTGIGVVEAPRGVLVHSYVLNRGLLERMRLYVATQFNNAFINLVLKDLADRCIEADGLTDRGQNLLARCVRLFDPCLTCATH